MSESRAEYDHGIYIKGGNGSHWDGCENVHWDCKIASLESQLAEAREDAEHLAETLRSEQKPGQTCYALLAHEKIKAKYSGNSG